VTDFVEERGEQHRLDHPAEEGPLSGGVPPKDSTRKARRSDAAPGPIHAATSWAVRASSALFGFAFAVALAPRLQLRARPEELLSALKAAGYSPRGLLLQFALAVLLTGLFAIVGQRVARLLADYRWAAIAYCAATLSAPLVLMAYGNLRHVLLIGAAAAAIVALRKRDPHFERGDVVLIPATLSCYLAFLDLGIGNTPVAALLRAAIAIVALRLILRTAEPFAAAPLALVAQAGWLERPVAAWIALVVLVGAPLLLAATKLRVPRRLVYPIVVFAYPLAVLGTPLPVTANFFEDGHNVPVAYEMLRGERPYTDIIPTHGLITDGLLDLAAMKLFGVRSLRTFLVDRLVAGMLSSVAIYCLVLAATGNAEVSLLGAFLAFTLFSGSALWMRPSGATFALAAAVAGTRLRSRRWFLAAGALLVPAYLISVDFAVYSAIVALVAAFRSRALRQLAIGIAAVLVPLLLLFALFGFAGDFLRVNAAEIFGGHDAGYLQPLVLPAGLGSPALLHHLASDVEPMLWIAALIASCVALARSPLRSRRDDGFALIGLWMVVAAAAYVRRGNFQFVAVAAPFLAASLWALSRHARTLATVLIVAVTLLAEPMRHVIEVIPRLRALQPAPMWDETTTSSIHAARHFVSGLRPADTFVDFTNAALLYPILGRDCPLRQVTVAAYQSDEAQAEVIVSLERNRHVRAALIAFPGTNQQVDGIANAQRAPRVWKYLETHFVPAFEEAGVVFWVRNDPERGPS
jgi:hypothetical protein